MILEQIRSRALGAALLVVVCVHLPTPGSGQEPAHFRPTFEPAPCSFDAAALGAGRVRCGYVAVPENQARPDGRLIRLAVAVAEPAVATPSDVPVALLPGGPGGSMLQGGRGIPVLRGWVGDRTVVVFDYRGTGETGPLMCPALRITQADIAALDLSLEQANALERGASLACRDELLNQGIDLTAYHGGSIARDVRDIREALGYPEWDIFGGSYGSWIARRVLREDPRGTRSATIMAGPPADPTRLLTRDIPFFDRALKHVFSLCEADASCRSHHPRLEEVFHDTYEHLEREPWAVTVDPTRLRRTRFTVNGQDFIRMMYWLLGDGDFVHLPALVTAFHDRDEAVARRMIDRQYGGLSSSFSTGMAYAVECYESHTPESRAERERAAARFPASLLDIRDFLAPCDDLHPARASAGEREVIRSTIPTLIVSAEHDMMGPPDVGEEIRRSLPNSVHVVLPGATHNAAFGPAYRPCLREIVMQFLEDPAARPATECLEGLPQPTISASLPGWAQGSGAGDGSRETAVDVEPAALADQVTIYRDAYGVPHVHGETDAAAVFGYVYAQAEDAFDEVEREVARMVGRLAEIDGEAALSNDLYIRALETERLSREEYERATPEYRAMADAWAAGLNHYLDRNPEVVPSAIRRFAPWQMFAVGGRSEMFGAPLAHGVLRTTEVTRAVGGPEPGKGSNMWMIGPGRTATGRAMLFINPHNAPETYLEGHLLSDEGLNVYGGNRPGRPMPVFGHTPRHGWAMTNNGPDVADLWRIAFDHPTDPLAYRYGDGYRVAEEWTETVRVRTDSGPEAREVTFRKTHQGPIVAVRDGVPLALRIARWEEGGTVQQFHAMARARSFEEFRDAVGQLREIWLSIGYADGDGNIWYVHNGAVPRRSPEFDWTQPVDGSDPRTEWQGYHSLDELPQVLNPESGWLMNTNHSPFRVTAEGENPDPADYPAYMVQSGFGAPPVLSVLFDSLGDNARARASRRILSGKDRFTFEEWAEATMSKRAWEADADVPALVAAWERLRETDPDRAARLGPTVQALRSWDRVSRHESVAMTLYTLLKMRQLWSWIASLEDPPFTPPAAMDIEPLPPHRWDAVTGLEKVIALLERDWGTWRVPYGEFSRLQRSPDGRYTDHDPSVPVLGGFPEAGMIQLFIPFPLPGQKRWYGFVSGNSYVSVVGFGERVRARSVNGSGQSTDPASPHYTDQAALYGLGAYKPAWTTIEEVRTTAVRHYRPGAESGTARDRP